MRMFELRTLDPLPDGDATAQRNQNNYNKIKDKATFISNLGDYSVVESHEGSDTKRWFILQDDKVIGLFKFHNQTMIHTKYWVASYVWVDLSARGKGLAKAIYQLFIEKNKAVVSDFEQTEDSKRIWRSLFGKYNCYGLFWNEQEEQEWAKIDSKEELEKAWPPVEKYMRLMLSSGDINTKE
jgi:muconolactone delta-isomerase